MMNESAIRDRLIEHGQCRFDAPREQVQFTKEEPADRLLNDLDNHPHAFVLACIMDRQIKAERAWLIPYRFQQKLGDFSMATLQGLCLDDVRELMSQPAPLHRFVETMSKYFYAGIQRIADSYDGVASKSWADTPSSSAVIYRFLQFEGVGVKIASMAANILARELKVPFSDYILIDISADVHVRRVFGRLELTPEQATVEQLVYRARDLYPQFPGMLDFAAWEIGRNWCRPKKTNCSACYMMDVCPSAGQ